MRRDLNRWMLENIAECVDSLREDIINDASPAGNLTRAEAIRELAEAAEIIRQGVNNNGEKQ